MLKLALVRKAIKLFPVVDYTNKDNVKHARKEWIKAQYYLRDNKLSMKPLINIKGN
jgi:hypothetical protein